MLDGLQNELASWPNLNDGTAKKKKMDALNADGSAQTETWAVNDQEIKVPKGDMMAMLSLNSLAQVITWMKAEADATALVFHEFFKAHDQFKTTDPMFRQLISGLYAGGLITEQEKDAILRLGERSISRAEELFGRKLTLADFDA